MNRKRGRRSQPLLKQVLKRQQAKIPLSNKSIRRKLNEIVQGLQELVEFVGFNNAQSNSMQNFVQYAKSHYVLKGLCPSPIQADQVNMARRELKMATCRLLMDLGSNTDDKSVQLHDRLKSFKDDANNFIGITGYAESNPDLETESLDSTSDKGRLSPLIEERQECQGK